MNTRRLLGPPTTFVVLAGIALTIATIVVLVEPGPVQIGIAVALGALAWRTLSASVTMDGDELVVRNVLKTFRLPIGELDLRPRVVDPRSEYYTPGLATGFPGIPTASDDNTPQAAKWYLLEHGKERYFIDALMGRTPSNHEQHAWRLRQEIVAARGD